IRGGRGETMMPITPEIGHSLHDLLKADPGRFAESARAMTVPDLAEALRTLPPDQATEMVCALPFEVAVALFDEPELDGPRIPIAQRLPRDEATRLIEAMSADQQADLLRELEPADRKRLLEVLDPATRESMTVLLAWPSDSAGGIMTTEFTAAPARRGARPARGHH